MLSFVVIAIVSVLLLPVAAGIAVVWQGVLASLFMNGHRTTDQATTTAGWINSTVLVYAIALCAYLAFN